jgi:hypothetical protein
MVRVHDTLPPTPDVSNLPEIIEQCAASILTAPTATDNCAGTITGTTSDPLNYSAQGDYVVTWTFDDGNGQRTTQQQIVRVHDTTPPVITSPADATIITSSSTGMSVTYPAAVGTDNCDGTVIVSCSPVSGSAFPLGTTPVTCTAVDKMGNIDTTSFQVHVVYSWSGLLGINADGSSVFKLGRGVTIAFQLTGASANITTAVAKFTAIPVGASVPVASSLLKYDKRTRQYGYSWSTKGLSRGAYQLNVDLGDGVPHSVQVTLN